MKPSPHVALMGVAGAAMSLFVTVACLPETVSSEKGAHVDSSGPRSAIPNDVAGARTGSELGPVDSSETRSVTSRDLAGAQDRDSLAGRLGNGYRLLKILATRGSYYAVSVEDTAASQPYVLLLQVRDDTITFLLNPIALEWFGLPDTGGWIALEGQEVNAVFLSFEDIVEGIVGTRVYGLAGDTLAQVYRDGTVCRPAEFRDLDRDGRYELLSYIDDPLDGQFCAHPCHLVLLEKFDIVPAWVVVQRWNGEAWVLAEREFPDFYRDLAQRYTEVDEWLREGAGSGACPYADWLKGQQRDYFARLASRALAVAESGSP